MPWRGWERALFEAGLGNNGPETSGQASARKDKISADTVTVRPIQGYEPYPWDLLTLADPSVPLIKEYLRSGSVFVAELGAKVIGVYVLRGLSPRRGELVNIAVDPDTQGRGIGTQLVEHCLQTARQRGWETLEVGTGNSSAGPLALYQKCGFRITSIDRGFFLRHYPEPITEDGVPCVDMVRLSRDL